MTTKPTLNTRARPCVTSQPALPLQADSGDLASRAMPMQLENKILFQRIKSIEGAECILESDRRQMRPETQINVISSALDSSSPVHSGAEQHEMNPNVAPTSWPWHHHPPRPGGSVFPAHPSQAGVGSNTGYSGRYPPPGGCLAP